MPLLRQALRQVAHPTIRNRGTTVGSLVHADPAAEMPAVLLLLDGSVTLRSADGHPRGRGGGLLHRADGVRGCGPASSPSSATFRRPPAGQRHRLRRGRPPPRRLRGLRGRRRRHRGHGVTPGWRWSASGDGPVLVDLSAAYDGRPRPDGARDLVDARDRPGGRHPRQRRLPSPPRARAGGAGGARGAGRRWARHDATTSSACRFTVNGAPYDLDLPARGCSPTRCATTCG